MPRFVMPDSIRHPLPHEPWIADQVLNDDTSFMVHMQFRFPKKGLAMTKVAVRFIEGVAKQFTYEV